MAILWTSLMVLGLTMVRIDAIVTVEKIETNGLMFKTMGNVYSYEQSWKIVTVISEEKFKEEQIFIESRINDLKKLNDKNTNKNVNFVLEEFERLNNVIKEINSIVLDEKPTRIKRAIVPFGGTLVEWILGNPDEYTLKEIIKQIEENRQNNIQTDLIIKNQTIYMQKLIEAIEEKNSLVNTEIEKLVHSIQFLTSIAIKEERNGEINALTQALTLVIIRYLNYQNKLLTHILSRDLIRIDPELIPISFLRTILEEIQGKIKNEFMLPWNLWENGKAVEWYKTIPMKTSIVDKNVVLEFIIPVISRIKKELYEVISTPVLRENTLVYIHPTTPYIITNEIKNEIGYLEQSDLDKCWRLMGKDYICTNNFPIYNAQNKYVYCELAILLKSNSELNNCIVKTIPKKDLFIKIKDSDQYYFVLLNKTHATQNCNGKNENIELEGTGILTINESCSIFNANFRIASQSISVLNKKK